VTLSTLAGNLSALLLKTRKQKKPNNNKKKKPQPRMKRSETGSRNAE